MIPDLPIYISALFVVTTIAMVLLFNWVVRRSAIHSVKKATAILVLQLIWLTLQGALAYNRIYSTNLKMTPPRLLILGLLPPILVIVWLFLSKTGRVFIDSLPLKPLIILNVIRIPVEVVLFCLYLNGTVPQLMTFEGGNLDIISGITAPIVAYYAFKKYVLNRKLILAWNFLCLGLLVNIIIRALLSAPFPSQKFAFAQPNIAILNFPFVWLPAFIVPIVLFGHLTVIRQLLYSNRVQL